MTPLVIDIYHNDPVESFQEIKDAGILAIIHKASEGSRRDQLYEHRRQAFVDLGFKWGAYHFFHGNGKAEADFFLSAAQPDENTLLALDWEPTPNGVTPSYAAARAFLERIEEKLGRKAVVYSGNVAKEQIKGRDAFFSGHRLWLAQYAAHWKTQASWDKPWLWQYGSEATKSRVQGIRGYCDVNNILDADEEGFFKNWVEPPPAPRTT